MTFIRARVAAPCVVVFGLFAAPAFAGSFDGQWILSTQSNRANCGGNTNEISVSDGRISGDVVGKNGIYSANGTVSDTGKIRFQLDAGTVLLKGEMKDGRGTGRFNAGHCRGKFTMTRK